MDLVPELKRIAADLTVTQAIAGCTPEEKVLLAALIPEFLKIIRSGGHIGIANLPEVPSPGFYQPLGTANANQTAEPSTPEAKE
jgi:hypothetical protein